ncbi:SWR1 complex protein, SNF2 family DNA-dependent ATPase [Oopsacas minuta]|uniref:SWR1 complex protein, SNF2 family DNA-dependent ATPase n=1 Tax=Oopsacas minuta TaxID=111878 RepID=A0AAV7JB90_9METZ|nr:SWR1 complex protein, SNF2 family DNA-dependent ATPase [Oopsacas minuta]
MNVADTPTATSPLQPIQNQILIHYRSQLEAIEADYVDLLKERFLLTGLSPTANLIDASTNSISSQQQVDSRVEELRKEAMSTPKSPHTLTSFLRPTRGHQTRPPDRMIDMWHSNDDSQTVTKDDPAISQIQHESSTLKRALNLRQRGLWEPTRLPKVWEPPRIKAHWDYLLEEMSWLASDFDYERKYRAATLRRISRAVDRYHHDKESADRLRVAQEQAAIKRKASAIAKQVHNFWSQMVKIVEWKEQIVDDHVKKYNLQSQLSDLLSQTENYSHKIRMGVQAPNYTAVNGHSSSYESDSERSGEEDEVKALHKEADLPLDDLVDSLPPEYIKKLLHNHHSISSEPNRSTPILSKPVLKEAEQELGNRELSTAAELAKNLQPSGNTLSTSKVSIPVPSLLKGGQLREYQHIGLNWLSMLHTQGLNGFLADEMGLGKTIQTIALLSHLACQEGTWGPHLIIVPTSVILNWEYEFKKWCPAFKLVTYYGNAKVRRNKRIGWTKQNAFHVCITSYQLAVTDQLSLKGKIDWDYIILDEAQNIKNYKSQRWQTLLTFKSRRRLLLSGTPLQNNIMELWALMHFLMPDLFSCHSDFKEWFSKPLMEIVEGNQTQRDRVVERLHRILRPFLLRRLKCEVELQLPKKIEHIIPCHLSKRQRFLYEDYMSLSDTRDRIKTGGAINLLNILMQLRKVCNHPDLFEPRPAISPLSTDPLTILLPFLLFMHGITRGFVSGVTVDKFELFQRIGLDLISEVTSYLTAFGSFRANSLSVKHEGFTPDNFPYKHNPLPSYPTTESNNLIGDSLTQLLQEYNTEVSREEVLYANRLEYMYSVNCTRLNRPIFYGADLIDSLAFIRHATTSEISCYIPHITDPLCENNYYVITTFSQYIPSVKPQTPRLVTTSALDTPWCYESTVDQCYIRRHISESICNSWDIFRSYDYLQLPQTRLIQYDCGKLQVLDKLLYQLKTEGHRVIVFTQMSRMLNILEVFLNYHGYKYFRLDGSTSPEDRFYLVERFNNDPSIFVFILSTRSGGIGMNLTGADTVIFYDIDWNPTMDAQAQDRCHRIGQTKNVHIYRLICEGTIEVNILKKSQQKKLLGELAIEEGHFTTKFFESSSDLDKGLTEIAAKIGEDGNNLSSLLFEVEEDTDAKFAKHATTEAKISEENDILEQSDRDNLTSSILPITLRSEIESDFLSLQEELNSIENFALLYLERNLHNLPFKHSPSNIFSILARESDQTQNHFLGYSPAGYYFDSPPSTPLSSTSPSRAPTPPPSYTSDTDLMDYDILSPVLETDSRIYVDPFISSLYNTGGELIYTGTNGPIMFLSEEQMGVYKVKPPQLQSVTTADTEFTQSSNIHRKSLIRKMKDLPQINNLFISIKSEEDKQRIKKKLKSKLINEPLKKSPTLSPEHFAHPPWLLPSEWRLCHCVLNHLESPLGLVSIAPSQELNWSFVSDYLTSIHAEIRIPSECYEHYLHVIFRDKGNESDIHIQAKHKEKIKRVRARVEQLTDSHIKDNNSTITNLSSNKFKAILGIAKRRKPPQTHEPISPLPYQSHSALLQNLNISPSSTRITPLTFAQNKIKFEKESSDNFQATSIPVRDSITPQPSHAAKFTFQSPYPPNPTPPYPYTPTTPLNTPYPSNSPYPMGPWDTRPTTPGVYSSLPTYPAARTMKQVHSPFMSSPARPQPDELMDTSQMPKYIQNYPNYFPKRYTNSDAYSPLPEPITPITPLQHQHQLTPAFFPKVPIPMQHPVYSPIARTPSQPSCSHLYMGANTTPYPQHQNSNPVYNTHSAINAYSPSPLNSYPHHANSTAFNMNTNSNIYHTNSYSPVPTTPLLNEIVQNELPLPPSTHAFYPPSGLNSTSSTI